MADLHIVTPGEVITSDTNYMRGHGTYQRGDTLVSSLAGVVHKINKLISVRPVRARYNGEIGDVVVGRVTEVTQNRWKVDCNTKLDSVLMLASVNLPGGVQRRRSAQDELVMREFLQDGDLISAEVQSIFQDGALSLHTRSLKYGKLGVGTFVTVPPVYIKRCKNHFHKLPCGVSVIIGVNGYIWITTRPKQNAEEAAAAEANGDAGKADEDVTPEERMMMARIRNCICALSSHRVQIYDMSIIYAYDASLTYTPGELLEDDVASLIAESVRQSIQEAAE